MLDGLQGQWRWNTEIYGSHDGVQGESFRALTLLYRKNAIKPKEECGVDTPERGIRKYGSEAT